jgi:hypothetical protein
LRGEDVGVLGLAGCRKAIEKQERKWSLAERAEKKIV